MSRDARSQERIQQSRGLAGRPIQRARTLAELQGLERARAARAGITDDILAVWPQRFTIADIVALRDASISPERAARWPQRFRGADIVAFEVADAAADTEAVTPAQADAWPERFTGAEIVLLVNAAIDPITAGHYPRRFTGSDIEWLDLRGIDGLDAAAYPSWCSAAHVAAAHARQITPGELAALAGGDYGESDPDAWESDRKLAELFGPGRLPVGRLDEIRPLPDQDGPDWV